MVWETLTSTMLGTATGGSVLVIYARTGRIPSIDLTKGFCWYKNFYRIHHLSGRKHKDPALLEIHSCLGSVSGNIP